MTQKEVEDALIKVHKDIQVKLVGNATGVALDACPLGGLPMFDSQVVPTAIYMVATELGVRIPDQMVENFYVSENGKKKLTIREIAQRLFGVFTKLRGRDS